MDEPANFDTLFIGQYYWPEPIGSGPYCRDLAESLAQSGRRVMVLTCRPHYPGGAVFADYRRGARDREIEAGVVVRRVRTWIPKRRSAGHRILSELWFFVQGMAALFMGRVPRSELVVCLCPTIFAVLLGGFARRKYGRTLALVHDIQSGLAVGLGLVGDGRIVRLMRALERFAFNRVDQILVLSEPMRRRLVELGVRTPISILPIWVDTASIFPIDGRARDTVTLLYSGNFGRKQALDQVIDLASALEARQSSIRVILRGEGGESASLRREAVRRGLRNLDFEPLVGADALNRGLADGDIHLVPQDGRAADFAVPSKIYAIMAAGRPLIATARPGTAVDALRTESGAFECVPPGDIDALTEAVLRLAGDSSLRRRLGARGRAFVMEKHDRARVLGSFLAEVAHGA